MRRHLWLGVNFNEEIEKELLNYNAKILSGSISEHNLIAGMDLLGCATMDTINSYQYPYFPRGPIYVRKREWTRNSNSKDISVSYLNIKYLNHFLRKISLKKEITKWAKELVESDEVVVFVYSLHSPFLAAAKALKRIHKNTKIVTLVLDLPQFMDMNMSRLKKVLKAIDWTSIQKYMKSVDKYVLYSKHMAKFLGLKDGTWMVMEGSYDPSLLIDCSNIQKDDSKVSVMYSGVLDLRYGIRELLDAMNLLDDNYELWLTGNGNAGPLIEERAKTDSRIKFYGFLPSREALLKKQHEATMLISTRDPSEEASKYCFPSKLFEYMVSGNPVLSTVIEGIPEEYFSHLVLLPDIRPETIAGRIKDVAKMNPKDRHSFGSDAMRFVLENKNNVAQMKRVLEFLTIV